MTERRAAPRQAVLQIVRTGRYPNVQYLHRLACGHTESRKRQAPAPRIGCTTCLATSRLRGEVVGTDAYFDESLYAGTQAELAAALMCDPSSVRVEVDSMGTVRGATVFLTPTEIQSIKGRFQ